MPHDIYGTELQVGDRVLLECEVTAVHKSEDYCNVDLRTVHPRHPSTDHQTIVANSKQVAKAILTQKGGDE